VKPGDLVRIQDTNEVGIVLRTWGGVYENNERVRMYTLDVEVLRTNGEIEEWEDDELEVISEAG
jgi:hypothetical protein